MFLDNEAIAVIILTFGIGIIAYALIEYENLKKGFDFEEDEDPPLK